MLQAFCGLASICLTLIKLIPFFFCAFLFYIFVFNFLVVAAAVVVFVYK